MEPTGLSPPQARDQGLLCRDLPDGMLVYDEERHRAHSLNRTAALIWRHCDGKTSVPELAVLLENELNLPADEEVVWLALDRLQKAQLLQQSLARPVNGTSLSRRTVIRKLGLVGGLTALLPLVDTLTAPRAAYAQSPAGGACTTPCQPCGPAANPTTKLCCSGPSNVLVCVSSNSENCRRAPTVC